MTVARADVDGDGHPDLILLYGQLSTRRAKGGFVADRFTLKVLRARGGQLTARIARPDVPPTITAIADVNNRPGDEIFVHQDHLSSGETIGVYTFNGHRLRNAGGPPFFMATRESGSFPAHGFTYGGDSGLHYGFACLRDPARIVQHAFELWSGGENGSWKRTDTTYEWVGAQLVKITVRHTTTQHGFPRGLIGANCGRRARPHASQPSRYPNTIYPPPVKPRYRWGSLGSCASTNGVTPPGPHAQAQALHTLRQFTYDDVAHDRRYTDRAFWPNLPGFGFRGSGLSQGTDRVGPASRSPYASLVGNNCGAKIVRLSLQITIGPTGKHASGALDSYLWLIQRHGHWLLWFSNP
ncbi:MAG: hypothetical protein ACRDNS_01395 [Trebonia sp.]